MIKSLIYKEWTKTKLVLLMTGIVFAGFIVYSFINSAQMLRIEGAVSTWYGIITLDVSMLPSVARWLPILAAAALALAQFTPEMTNKRLKLTLHLPMTESRTISVMVLYGTAVLVCLFALTYAVLYAGLAPRYTGLILTAMVWKTLPWFLAGLTAYFLTAWICIEPTWRQRVMNALVSVCLLAPYFITAISGAYSTMLPWLMLTTAACFFFPFYSTARFKEGVQ